jgi:hypothetical protein
MKIFKCFCLKLSSLSLVPSVVKQNNIDEISKTSSPDLEIQDIQSIGPTTAKKLKDWQ